MAKRTATTELTDRNWDEEDEHEEAGEFSQAPTEVIQRRQIIKAKRKNPSVEGSGGGKSFTGFSGFSFKPMSASTPLSFNAKSVTNGKSETTESKETLAIKAPLKFIIASSPVTLNSKESKTEISAGSSDKMCTENLRKLNESVLSWIQKHVEKNPYCILTPIFKDYERHLEELEKAVPESKTESNDTAKDKAETPVSTATSTTVLDSVSTTKPAFSFGTSATATSNSGFTFGSTAATTVASTGGTNGSTIFGRASGTTTGFPGFSFSSNLGSKPSPYFAVGQASGEGASKEAEEEEYEPPKPEVKEVKEEGALHTVKCKLFYQKGGVWTDRGVGFLHLKKSNEKAQLVVRADTSLGNILLNIILSSSLPLSRQGKNNVSMMCVPNPPLDSKTEAKPTPMLIRVKTAEDADTLLEKMNELRN